jgi:hypothetical protein
MRQQLTAAKPNCLVVGLQKFELLINVGCTLREKIFEFRQQGLAATVSNNAPRKMYTDISEINNNNAKAFRFQ